MIKTRKHTYGKTTTKQTWIRADRQTRQQEIWTHRYRACSQENESRSERRFGTWFGPFLILLFMNAKLFEIRLLKCEKKDRDPRRKPDSRTCECKALSERDSCVCILEMCAEAMRGSISADCAVGTKYYLAVRRSWSWLGRRLQCMWMHVVQITKRIRSFVNTAIDILINKNKESTHQYNTPTHIPS